MRKIQKIVIVVYGILVAIACTYVPWRPVNLIRNLNLLEYNSLPIWLKYSLFWKPVAPKTLSLDYNTYGSNYAVITTTDYRQIVLELIAVTAIFVILFILTLRPKQNEK